MRSLLPRLKSWSALCHDPGHSQGQETWGSRVGFGTVSAVLLRDGTGRTRIVTVASSSRIRSAPCPDGGLHPRTRRVHVAVCSGEPNLIFRARQMSHCQSGQSLMGGMESFEAGDSRRGMSSISFWKAVRTVLMTAQGPCHHPSTRRGVTGPKKTQKRQQTGSRDVVFL